MKTLFTRTWRHTAVVCMIVTAGAADAQQKALPELDPAVLSALSRDLKLAPQQVIERVKAEQDAAERHRALKQSLGAAYAGAWFDASSNALVVATTDARQSRAVQLSGARPVVATRSFQQLIGTQSAIDQAAAALTDWQLQRIWSWSVDVKSNDIVISVPADDPAALGAAEALVALSKVDRKAVRIEPSHDGRPVPAETIRGGDYYWDSSWGCSVGFSVNGGFLTAGHCGTAGQVTTGFNGVQMGTFAAAQFPTVDRGWVQTNSNWTPSPCVGSGASRICTDPNNRIVGGSTEAVVGSTVCRWGATTGGPHCGVIETRSFTANYAAGNVYGLVKTTACAEPGDSGGPFMWNYQAQGMTSGTDGGTCTTGGHSFFWPVNDALTWYGRSLTLSSTPPTTPTNFSVGYTYSAGKYRYTASWSAVPGATSYHLTGHAYNGPNTSISWTLPENYADPSIEYYVSACNAAGCSPQAGPAYAP